MFSVLSTSVCLRTADLKSKTFSYLNSTSIKREEREREERRRLEYDGLFLTGETASAMMASSVTNKRPWIL